MKSYLLKYNGNILYNRELPLVVGQCGDADLRLPSDSRWVDENYFVITYREDEDCWCIIRLSDNIDIKINGVPLDIARFLESGDVIDAEDTTLRFIVYHHSSSPYFAYDGIHITPARLRRRVHRTFAVIAFIIAAVICLYGSRDKVEDFSSSVLKTNVDSVFVQHFQNGKYETIERIECSFQGTCFVTCDGLLVTARHCIQPWLELNPMQVEKMDDSLCKMVMRVETALVQNPDTLIRIVSKLQIDTMTFMSSDFSYNNDRDIIINYGTRKSPSFWRSILPAFHQRDNALGDIAWMRTADLKGNLRLAKKHQVSSLEKEEPISILGYSTREEGNSDSLMLNNGIIKELSAVDTLGNPLSCIFHNDDASKGDSGGPVLIKRGLRYYVISVMSRKDAYRMVNSSWSVPVSEIRENK